jgi:hypothetical protein
MIQCLSVVALIFNLTTLAQATEKAWKNEWIAGSTLIFNFEEGKEIPYVGARVFVKTSGCTEKKSFELKISSISFEKNVHSPYMSYGDFELPIIDLTLIRKEPDGCLGYTEIIPIDFSAEEIATAVNKYLKGQKTITRDDVHLIRWTNLNMPIRLELFNYGVTMPIGPLNP